MPLFQNSSACLALCISLGLPDRHQIVKMAGYLPPLGQRKQMFLGAIAAPFLPLPQQPEAVATLAESRADG
jgi:hypothetical protein